MRNELVLSASLYKVIQDWTNKQAELDEWIDGYWPDDGVRLMTDAAMSVLKAIESSSQFTQSEMPR
jgi:hypothetical protein